MKNQQHHDGEEKKKAQAEESSKSPSIAGKVIPWLVIAFLLKLVLPNDAGAMVHQTYVLVAEHYRDRFDLDAVLRQGLLLAACGLGFTLVLVVGRWLLSKKPANKARVSHEDVIGAMFEPTDKKAKLPLAMSGPDDESVVVSEQREVKAASPVNKPIAPAVSRSRVATAAPSPTRNFAFVFSPRLEPFYRELLAHDWTTETSADPAKQRSGKANRKAIERAANQSDEHRALYEAYIRFAAGQAGRSGDSLPMPVQATSDERPLFVEAGLQDFFAQLEAHDWYYAQRTEPARTKGKLERHALESIARRTPQHMALLNAFRAYQYSGDAWGTPQRPAPVLRPVVATKKAPRHSQVHVVSAPKEESSTTQQSASQQA